MADIEKAVWSVAYINDLADSAFAYIESGGQKDSEGKTVPRNKRHLPYKDKDGKIDAAHVRNALARLDMTDISDDAKASARRKLNSAAKKAGINTSDESKKTLAIPFEYPFEIMKTYEDNEKWYIEGYAGSTELDLTGDIITEEAFKEAEEDLLNNSTVLYNHDPEQPIGKVDDVKATKDGLWVKILISKTAQDIWQKVKEGVINKFSIRGRVLNAVKRFIKDVGKVVNIINELYLIEASLVALPANPEAKALRWYITKSLQQFELEGGEIPKEHGQQVVSEKEPMEKIVELLKQLSERLVADEDKAIVETLKSEIEKACKPANDKDQMKLKKKSGEEWTQEAVDILEKTLADLQASFDIEKQKKVLKNLNDMNDEDMKEVVNLSDEIRKNHTDKFPYPETILKTSVGIKKATGEFYTQEEIDILVKDIAGCKTKISELEKQIADLNIDKEVEKRWDNMKHEYNENDAVAIKSILKKSVAGLALTAEETESLVAKKLNSSELKIGGDGIVAVTKSLTEERRQELLKKGGIKTRIK